MTLLCGWWGSSGAVAGRDPHLGCACVHGLVGRFLTSLWINEAQGAVQVHTKLEHLRLLTGVCEQGDA